MKKIYKYTFTLLFALSMLFSSCDKFVEIPESKNQIETDVVFADSAIATSALLGVYYTLGSPTSAVSFHNKYMSLYSDEYLYTSSFPSPMQFGQSKLLPDNFDNTFLWNNLYSVVYQCNSLIEGVNKSTGLTQSAKTLLKGEAEFLRAFANFYLVNLYDNIPLILTTEVSKNAHASQNSSDLVYDQIIKDLLAAKSELGLDYKGAGRVRANSLVASALLARVYLYLGKWNEAEQEATRVISTGLYTPLPLIENVFLANSQETILQFWNQNGFLNDTYDLIPALATDLPQYTITPGLYEAFDANDIRKSHWISTNIVTIDGVSEAYHYPSKYKNKAPNAEKSEYLSVLRLSEQYLIRAEALAQQENIADAVAGLNVIRNRAGLLPLPNIISKQDCLTAIAKERQLELFGEWGHRFMDLKRTRQLNQILGPLKSTWKATAKAFPIPQNELTYNSKLIQNDGY